MSSVPIPFVDESVDTSDGVTGVAMTLVMVIVGFAILSWARGVGGYVAEEANEQISGLIGVDPTSGDSNGGDLL